jgi:hypothetical protein
MIHTVTKKKVVGVFDFFIAPSSAKTENSKDLICQNY